MSVTVPPEVTDRAPSPVCALCGRPMAADQEWCMECGAARTVIARPPDWRIPVAVIGVVVALVIGGFVFALTQIGGGSGTVTVMTSAASTRSGSRIGGWQPGLDGYTVVLATAASQAAAQRQATKLAAHVSNIGVLSTSQHPEMKPQGVWEVYAGRYPSYLLAQAAASKAVKAGYATAVPRLVQHPGGG